MKFISDTELADFFSKSPMYRKNNFLVIQKDEHEINIYEYLGEKGYKDFCQRCRDFQTFRIEKKYGSQLFLSGDLTMFRLGVNSSFDYTFQIGSKCQFCQFEKEYLIKIFSVEKAGDANDSLTFKIQKVGQFPAIERLPEKDVYNYLTDEDRQFYSKALTNLANGYGIGAYAYFRRIVENEIMRIIIDISNSDIDNADKVRQALSGYKVNHQMSPLIDAISPFLPPSLKEFGNNPLKLLYQQTSEAIHSFSDEEGLNKARDIDILLQFVIKRTSALKIELKEVQQAMKNLSR